MSDDAQTIESLLTRAVRDGVRQAITERAPVSRQNRSHTAAAPARMTRKAHTYDQAAEQLGVSGETIRQLVNAGELLPISVTLHAHGRAVRISDAELDRFIAAREDAQRQKVAHLPFRNTAHSRA